MKERILKLGYERIVVYIILLALFGFFIVRPAVITLYVEYLEKKAMNTAEQAFEYIFDDDLVNLASLYSKSRKQDEDFEENLQILLDFIEGQPVDTPLNITESGYMTSYDKGIVEYDINVYYSNSIYTNSQKTYDIEIHICLIDLEEPERVGITGIVTHYTGEDNRVSA